MLIAKESIAWLFDDDHHPYARYFCKSGPIWGILYLLCAGLLSIFYLIIPRKKELKAWQQWCIDGFLAISLPICFCYHLGINGSNEYWFSSMIFSALCYGILARAQASEVEYQAPIKADYLIIDDLVRWCRPSNPDLNLAPGMGIEFLSVTDDQKRLIGLHLDYYERISTHYSK